MARIRSTHPGQWSDEDFVACSMAARLLAIAIRNEADDQGVFEWKPLSLKMKLFPADQVDMDALLTELVDHRHIIRFEHCGKSYGAVRNFRKYQRPKKPTAIYPLPNEFRIYVGLNNDGSEQVPHQLPTSSENPPQMEDGGDSRKEEEPPVVPLSGDDTDFDSWWSVYPRRVGKGQARKAFKAALKKTDLQTLIDGVKRYAASRTGEDAKFTAHPASWLNAERWLDDFTAEGVKSESQVVRERAETDAHQATIRRSAEKATADSRARLLEAARIAQERRECTNPPTGTPDDVSRTTGQI